MAQSEWRKTPKFILRWDCIDDVSRSWNPGYFVEPGAGTGTVTREFLARGYHGVAQDIADETCAGLRANLAEFGDSIQVVAEFDEDMNGRFDYLFSFEVIEHIPDDVAAVRRWAQLLRPGGRLLLSTPAHQRRYSSADKLVGHVRRYERDQLLDLLQQSGFEQIELYNYGYPLGNLTRVGQGVVDRLIRKREVTTPTSSAEARSIDSGVRTHGSVNLVSRVLNEKTLRPAAALQRRFYQSDRGDGWVATAVKPSR